MNKTLFLNAILLITASTQVVHASLISIGNEEQFNKIIQAQAPSVIVFSAEWCPKCNELEEPLHAIIDNPEFKDIVFAKVDVDANPTITRTYNLQDKGIPTIMFMQHGEKKHEIIGALDEAMFKNAIRTTFAQKGAETEMQESGMQREETEETAATEKDGSSSNIFQALINILLSIFNYVKEMITTLFCTVKCSIKDMSSRK